MKKSVLSLILMVALMGIVSCKDRKNDVKNNNAIAVQVQNVSIKMVDKQLAISGNIEGNKTVRLGFMVAGKLNFIAKEEGQTIEYGELLASLDPESYSIAKDMADANFDQTQDEFNRLSQMYERKSISESDFNKITNALKAAKAQQRLQAKNLSDSKLYSPISGVLLKKGVEVGEIIGVGLPLFVVSNIQIVKVNASVPESEIHLLKLGDEANVYIAALNSNFTGKIIEIGSFAEAATRSFSIKIELKNPNRLIRPGMVAEVQIKTGEENQSIAVPAEAILHDIDNSSYVFIADSINNQAFKRKISLGDISDNNIEVISGLTPGELIVVKGQQKLSNGSSITLK